MSAKVLISDKQSDKYITIQEYEDAMSQVYAKHGIKWEIVDSSEAMPITMELFEMEIARAEEECKKHQNELIENKAEYMLLEENLTELSNDSIMRLMPVTANYYRYLDIDCSVLATCRLFAYANATYDANNDVFLSLNSSNIIKYSGVNCNSWIDGGSSIYINSTRKSFYVHFVGTADFTYTIPEINVKVDQAIPIDGHYPWSTTDSGTYLISEW